VTVTTSDGLYAALKAAHPGDTIQLAAGNYTAIDLSNFNFNGTVTIQSADPAHEAVFTGLSMSNSSGLAFKNMQVSMTGDGYGVYVGGGSSNIAFSAVDVHGVTAVPGAAVGLGYFIRDSSGVSITNSQLSDLGSGIGHYNDNGLTISNNTLTNLEADGIFGGGSSHVVVTGNQLSDFHPAVGDHPDAIQFWGSSAGLPTPSDITIADNVITRGAGDVMQGIFIENSQNLTITGNAMAGTMYNGISLSNSTNTLIQNNFVQGDVDMSSWIIARNGSVNVTVTGNTVSSTIISTSDNVNYVQGPNTTIAPAAIGDVSLLNTWVSQHSGVTVVEPAVYDPPPAVIDLTSDTMPTGGVIDLTGAALDAAIQDEVAKAASGFFRLQHDWAIL
jgi:parallel beta-helix repeat protein